MVKEKTDIRQVTQANRNGSLRVCLPKRVIKSLDIQGGDLVRFFSEKDKVVMTKLMEAEE